MIERRRSLRNDSAYMLAVLYTIGFLGMCFLLVLYPVPETNKDIIQYLMGIMSAVQLGIIGYFYNVSKANSERDQAMNRIVEKAAPALVTAQVKVENTAVETNTATPTERKAS